MGPAAVSTVTGRIAAIEARFAAPTPAFAQALRAASAGPVPVTGGAPPATGAATVGGDGPGTPVAVAAASSNRGSRAGGAPPGGFAGDWAAGLPAAGRPWASAIERAALREGLDPALLASLVWAESGFRPEVRSHAGAIGLAQLMPGTAAGLGVDPHDPEQNLAGGARYLKQQLERFGSPELALAAYNAGPNRVARSGGIPNIAETRAYVPRVMGYYDQIRGVR